MPDLAEVFRRYGPELERETCRPLSPGQRQALRAIIECRTPGLGGHLYRCADCQGLHFVCHSCNHRLCPRCGAAEAQQWRTKQQARLLPTPYFLVTFTLPERLRSTAYAHQRLVYSALMQEAAATLQELAHSRLGGEAGFLGVLHTWTRQLLYHPHVHFVVAGGVWDQGQWRALAREGFLLPVRVLSRLFRRKLRARLEAQLPAAARAKIPRRVWGQEWVVHCQAAGSGREALGYLSAYVFRSAITDRRIVRDQDGLVTFRWRPSGSVTEQLCTLPGPAFVRRVLLHVLPKGLHKIRYFGWMHGRAQKRFRQIQCALAVVLQLSPSPPPLLCHRCPHCGGERLKSIARLPRMRFDSS